MFKNTLLGGKKLKPECHLGIEGRKHLGVQVKHKPSTIYLRNFDVEIYGSVVVNATNVGSMKTFKQHVVWELYFPVKTDLNLQVQVNNLQIITSHCFETFIQLQL